MTGGRQDGPTSEGRGDRSARWLLLFAVVVDSLSFAIILPAIPYFVISHGLSVVAGGLLVTVHASCAMLAAPFLGRLSDRYGRKPILVLTLAGTALSYVVFGLADSLPMIVAARALAGVMAGNLGIAQAALADITPENARGRAMGQVAGVWALGYVVGPALSALLAGPAAPNRAPGIAAAAIATVGALAVGLIWRPAPARATPPASAPPAARSPWAAGLTWALAAIVLVALCQNGVVSMTSYWAQRLLGWAQRDVSLLIAWVATGSVITQLALSPFVFKRARNTTVLAASLAVSAAGCAILIASRSPIGLIVSLPIIMSGLSLASTALTTAISLAAGARQGTSMGLATSAGAIGRILGPSLFGLSFAGLGPSSYFYWIALLCMAISLGTVLGVRLRPPHVAASQSVATEQVDHR